MLRIRALIVVCTTIGAVLSGPGPLLKTPETSRQVVLDLKDGSRLIGSTSLRTISLDSEAIHQIDIPIERVRTIKVDKQHKVVTVSLSNGDQVHGTVRMRPLEAQTLFGNVTIDWETVRSVAVRSGATAPPIPSDGLVLHYSFDFDMGGRVIDESGTGNDGRIYGAKLISEGRIGGAISFENKGDSVVVENSPSLQNQNFTIMAWIKLRDGEQLSPNRRDQEVCGYGQNGYLLGIGGRGEVYLTKTGVDHTTASFRVTDSRFHHLAVTKQGAKVVFYLDGEAHPAPDYDPDLPSTRTSRWARGVTISMGRLREPLMNWPFTTGLYRRRNSKRSSILKSKFYKLHRPVDGRQAVRDAGGASIHLVRATAKRAPAKNPLAAKLWDEVLLR